MAHVTDKIPVTEIDFDTIKQNLKTFLQSQTEFTDFDFEGAGMNIILDLLAYNTHYIAIHANMAGNEMFLDSATLRPSVVSLAKHLNYTPKSKTSPKALLNGTLSPIGSPPSLIITKGTQFTTVLDGVTYTFSTVTDTTVLESGGNYIFTNLPIHEGFLSLFQWTADTSLSNQRFVIPNNSLDTATLLVTVQNSVSDTTTFPYTRATTIDNITADSRVYWLQEVEDNKFEIIFGNAVVGQSLSNGNIIDISYLTTNGPVANSASTFVAVSTVGGQTAGNFTISTAQEAVGGASEESIESIRFLAPKLYSTQGRAVTIIDYQNILLEQRADIDIITGWGGEDNDPQRFGSVFLAIKPIGLEAFSNSVKIDIQNTLQDFSTIPIINPIIVDPDFTYFRVTSSVHYNTITLKDPVSHLQEDVEHTIQDYFSDVLNKFNETFRFSVLVGLIDDTNTAILNNDTSIVLEKRFKPTLGIAFTTALAYNNAISPSTLSSNSFTLGVLSGLTLDDDGTGTVRVVQGSVLINLAAGTVDYATGDVNINNIVIDSFDVVGEDELKVLVTPANNDVNSLRDQVLALDVTDGNSQAVTLVAETP